MNQEHEKNSLIDLLFYGSVSQETNLQPTSSQYFTYDPSKLSKLLDSQTRLQALIPRFPMDFLGHDYKSLFLPCTPACEIFLKIPLSELPLCEDFPPASSPAEILKFGFIKTAKETGFKGYRSGRRSAIYWDPKNKKYYRLKGCGNDESGFISSIGKVNLDPASKEIRGCHYLHTVKRELVMTDKIDTFLKEFGYESGNKSHGFWLYTNNLPEGLSNEFPKIQKFCAVFETLGEKRLATHLFQGFEALLKELLRVSEKIEGFNLDNLTIFPKDRVLPDGSFVKTPINFEPTIQEDPLINIFECIQENKIAFPLNEQNKKNLLGFLPEIIENLQIKAPYIEIFSEIFQKIFDENDGIKDFFTLSGILFARIGYEIGQIREVFSKKRINWGYYFDHHPYLAHCNAHPNNFVVLSDNQPGKNLIAPLDFDLCFEENEFININLDDKSYGEYDPKIFNDFLENERLSLEIALTGMENMDNFQYYSLNTKEVDKLKENMIDSIKIMLRDCLKTYYLQGKMLKDPFNLGVIQWEKQRKIYDLIKLSLIITNDCIG